MSIAYILKMLSLFHYWAYCGSVAFCPQHHPPHRRGQPVVLFLRIRSLTKHNLVSDSPLSIGTRVHSCRGRPRRILLWKFKGNKKIREPAGVEVHMGSFFL
jgi:hypothetical protein